MPNLNISGLNITGVSVSFAASGDLPPDRDFWIQAVTNAESETTPQLNAIDSTTNVAYETFVLGAYDPAFAGLNNFYIVKYSITGTPIWQTEIGDLAHLTNFTPSKIRVHPDGNLIVIGSKTAVTDSALVFKIDAALGTIVWQTEFLMNGESTYIKGLFVKASGEIMVAGYYFDSLSGSSQPFVTSLNTSGVLSATNKTLDWNSQATDCVILSDGSVVIVGLDGNLNKPVISKLDSSLTLMWSRYFDDTVYTALVVKSIACDASDNLYVCGTEFVGPGRTYLTKLNASGIVQWVNIVDDTTLGVNFNIPLSVTCQADGTNYLLTHAAIGGSVAHFVISKFSSAGTLLKAVALGFNPANDNVGANIHLDSFDDVYFVGTSSGLPSYGSVLVTGKIPNNGTLTGAYTIFGNNFDYITATSITSVPSIDTWLPITYTENTLTPSSTPGVENDNALSLITNGTVL